MPSSAVNAANIPVSGDNPTNPMADITTGPPLIVPEPLPLKQRYDKFLSLVEELNGLRETYIAKNYPKRNTNLEHLITRLKAPANSYFNTSKPDTDDQERQVFIDQYTETMLNAGIFIHNLLNNHGNHFKSALNNIQCFVAEETKKPTIPLKEYYQKYLEKQKTAQLSSEPNTTTQETDNIAPLITVEIVPPKLEPSAEEKEARLRKDQLDYFVGDLLGKFYTIIPKNEVTEEKKALLKWISELFMASGKFFKDKADDNSRQKFTETYNRLINQATPVLKMLETNEAYRTHYLPSLEQIRKYLEDTAGLKNLQTFPVYKKPEPQRASPVPTAVSNPPTLAPQNITNAITDPSKQPEPFKKLAKKQGVQARQSIVSQPLSIPKQTALKPTENVKLTSPLVINSLYKTTTARAQKNPSTNTPNSLIKVLVERAITNYKKWYRFVLLEENPKEAAKYRAAGFFTRWRHGESGQDRASAFNTVLQNPTCTDPVKVINDFFKGKDKDSKNKPTRFHVHSFATFLLDELLEGLRHIPDHPWASIKLNPKSKRYDKETVIEAVDNYERPMNIPSVRVIAQ